MEGGERTEVPTMAPSTLGEIFLITGIEDLTWGLRGALKGTLQRVGTGSESA